jgi:hypothetical protein
MYWLSRPCHSSSAASALFYYAHAPSKSTRYGSLVGTAADYSQLTRRRDQWVQPPVASRAPSTEMNRHFPRITSTCADINHGSLPWKLTGTN